MNNLDIGILEADKFSHSVGELSEILHTCVHAGASINFILPITSFESEQFWNTLILPGVLKSTRMVWGTRLENRVVGSVQLDCDTPPNQTHKAKVAEMMVHTDFRRQGIARCLMIKLETRARALAKTLITLDTKNSNNAEPLYAEMGYVTAGTIPRYCRDPFIEQLHATAIMHKAL